MEARGTISATSAQTFSDVDSGEDRSRLLETLECVLELPAGDLKSVLGNAADLIANALGADKVDAFLLDPARASLVAVGVSDQPLSQLEKRLGLDVLSIANGGRAVEVFTTGRSDLNGNVQEDSHDLLGVREGLGICSRIAVPLEVGGVRRGVILVASQQANKWDAQVLRFTESVVRWIGVVVHRTELIAKMNESAVAQGGRKAAEELITVVAHDMRNLLSPLEGRLELSCMRAAEDGRRDDVSDLRAAMRTAKRLRSMISEVLDVARIDHGLIRITSEPVDLARLLREVGEVMALPDKPIVIEAREPLNVMADLARMRQCLENLLGNAIAHTPSGTEVRVDAQRDVVRGTSSRAIVKITDHGPGVPEHLLPTLFDRFVAGEHSDGIGLGMYLAKQIALLHEGELQVLSSAKSGTTFVLTLPLIG